MRYWGLMVVLDRTASHQRFVSHGLGQLRTYAKDDCNDFNCCLPKKGVENVNDGTKQKM